MNLLGGSSVEYFEKITALIIGQRNAWDYFSVKLEGMNLWGKIVLCLTSFVAQCSKFF